MAAEAQRVAASDAWCIIDDFFPNPLTAFRVAEYNAYFAASEGLEVFCSHPRLDAFLAAYGRLHPRYADRIRPLRDADLSRFGFAHLTFLNNAFTYLRWLEAYRIPFTFTLYPGGGFGLGEAESDAKLSRVVASPLLQGVITTQAVSTRYLRERWPDLNVQEIFGGTFEESTFAPASLERTAARRWYCGSGEPLAIAFVAEKYMPLGANKGYPAFVAAAREIAEKLPNAVFHVIGGLGPDDIPLPCPERWRFHGRLLAETFRDALRGMHMVISPNVPFTLHPGNFDGFPTASCVEASICGAAMLVTDELGLNRHYADGEEIVIIKPDAADIVRQVAALASEPSRLNRLAQAGRAKSLELFSPAQQIRPRLETLAAAAGRCGVDLGFR